MASWTIGKRIGMVAGFLCLVISVIVTVAVSSVTKINHMSEVIADNALPSIIAVGKMKTAQADNMIRLSQYISATDPAVRKKLTDGMAETTKNNAVNIKQYEDLLAADEDRKLYETYKDKRGAFVAIRKDFLAATETDPEKAKAILDGPLTDTYKVYLEATDALVAYNVKLSQEQGRDMKALIKRAIYSLVVIGGISVLIGVGASIVGVRTISKTLRNISSLLNSSADQVSAAAGEVSSSSQKLAEGASEQAASLEETSASMEEISSIVQANAHSAQSSKGLANETRQTTSTNVERVQELRGAVSEAQTSSNQLTEAMEAIKASSDSISNIIKTIDEIAFQTNILALNAAVEAARAGEAGMGFAVVADEVRNLAKRSADAAKETTTIIEDSIRKSETGVRVNEEVVKKLDDIHAKSQQVDNGLGEILSQVSKVDDAMGHIATASTEQNQGIGQVNIALTQMDKATQSNAATAEETASAAEELNAQAEELKGAVEQLLALVDGKGASPSRHESPKTPAKSDPKHVMPHRDLNTKEKIFAAHAKSPKPVATAPERSRDSIPMEDDFRDMTSHN